MLKIYTYDGGKALYYAFNAIGSLYESGIASELINLTVGISAMFCIVLFLWKDQEKAYLRHIFSVLIMFGLVITPKTEVLIIDKVANENYTVANIPLLLALLSSASSHVGYILAAPFDLAFSKVTKDAGGLSMYQNGIASNTALIESLSTAKILDPLVANNLREYVQNCMIYDLGLQRYSMAELVSSTDLWSFMTTHAAENRSMPYKAGSNTTICSCAQALKNLKGHWTAEVQKVATNTATRMYGNRKFINDQALVNKYIQGTVGSYNQLIGIAQDSKSLFMQAMLVNAIKDSMNTAALRYGSSGELYAATKAKLHQKMLFRMMGQSAREWLPVMKVAFKVIWVGSFILVVILILLPGGGMQLLKKYALVGFWIESWEPLFSILNMLYNLESKYKLAAALKGINNLTLLNHEAILATCCSLNDFAGWAMLSVPALSTFLINGVNTLSGMAGQFGSSVQAINKMAAGEAVSSNVSMGNASIDNVSFNNVAANKYDDNVLYSTGRRSEQRPGGAMVHYFGDGSFAIDATPAIDKMAVSLDSSKGLSNSFTRSAEKYETLGKQQSIASDQTFAAAKEQALQWQQSTNTTLGHKHAYSGLNAAAANTNQGAVQTDGNVSGTSKIFDANIGLGTSIGAEASVAGGIGYGPAVIPYGVPTVTQNAKVGAGVNVKAGGGFTWNNYSKKEKSNSKNKGKSFTTMDNATFVQEVNAATQAGASWTEPIIAKISDAQALKEQSAQSYSKAKHYREAANIAESSSKLARVNYTPEFKSWLLTQNENGQPLDQNRIAEIAKSPTAIQPWVDKFFHEKFAAPVETGAFAAQFGVDNLKGDYQDNADTFQQDHQASINEKFATDQDTVRDIKQAADAAQGTELIQSINQSRKDSKQALDVPKKLYRQEHSKFSPNYNNWYNKLHRTTKKYARKIWPKKPADPNKTDYEDI